jgi:hypothetical protein
MSALFQLKYLSRLFAVCIMGFGFLLLNGCDSGGGGGGGGSSSFQGVWALYEQPSLAGSPTFYSHFQADKTFFFSNNADGSGVRLTGTYMSSGNELIGPFSNPPTGNGRIEARIENNLMIMDFIEFWHTPNKVIPLYGRRL